MTDTFCEIFIEAGIPAVGIEPADGPADVARAYGIEILSSFFDQNVAERLVDKSGHCDVLIANNVLAHVPDPNEMVAGASLLLHDNGLMVVEVPWLIDLLEQCAFDTVYHQHYSYFSLSSLLPLFKRHGLFLHDVRHYPVQGGSLRLYIGKKKMQGRRGDRVAGS